MYLTSKSLFLRNISPFCSHRFVVNAEHHLVLVLACCCCGFSAFYSTPTVSLLVKVELPANTDTHANICKDVHITALFTHTLPLNRYCLLLTIRVKCDFMPASLCVTVRFCNSHQSYLILSPCLQQLSVSFSNIAPFSPNSWYLDILYWPVFNSFCHLFYFLILRHFKS